MSKLLFTIMFSITFGLHAQTELSANKFHWEIRRGVTVVEFWAGWNRGNEILFLHELNNCRVFRHVIRRDRSLLDEFNVTAVPTIIVFKNGYEEFRFAPNIMLKVTATKEQVQSAIDDL